MLDKFPTIQLERMRQRIAAAHASPEGVMTLHVSTKKIAPTISANKRRVLGQLDAELARRAAQAEAST